MGKKADGQPWAELWMGDHPKAPSRVLDAEGQESGDLAELIAADPDAALGEKHRKRFGPRLPFLFKLLSAAQPLSIQAHPNKQQAEEGFEREQSEGIDIGAAGRNYRDQNHKPEIIAALTPFTAMCGFRSPRKIAGYFHGSGLTVTEALEGGLQHFFHALLHMDDEERRLFVAYVRRWARDAETGSREERLQGRLIRRFLELYPDDPAVAAPLYLHTISLEPGEALYQPAGMLHAYVEGTGIELMANSDNVLRGGLTPKHIDKRELERVLCFRDADPRILRPSKSPGGMLDYPTPIDEFLLSRFDGGHAELSGGAPRILLCLGGRAQVQCDSDGGGLAISQGESLFIPAFCSAELDGEASIYCASLPGGRT